MGARERIILEAGQVFAEEGYFKTSIRSVAQRAGVTNPTIYYHFGSKEGLYRAVLEGAFSRHGERVARATDCCADARSKLIAYVQTSIDMTRERPWLARLAYLARIRSDNLPGVQALFAEKKEETTREITGYLDELAGGRLPPRRLEFVAIAFMCLVFGLVQHIVLDGEEFDTPPEEIRWLVDRFFEGLGRPDSELEAPREGRGG